MLHCFSGFSQRRPFPRKTVVERFLAEALLAAARRGARSTVAFARDVLAVTKALGLRPLLAVISSIDRPEATDLSSSRIRLFFPVPGKCISMLDEQPIGALLALSLAHSSEDPASVKLLSLQSEIQLSFE
jgi:hypothetical protein